MTEIERYLAWAEAEAETLRVALRAAIAWLETPQPKDAILVPAGLVCERTFFAGYQANPTIIRFLPYGVPRGQSGRPTIEFSVRGGRRFTDAEVTRLHAIVASVAAVGEAQGGAQAYGYVLELGDAVPGPDIRRAVYNYYHQACTECPERSPVNCAACPFRHDGVGRLVRPAGWE